MLAIEIRKYYRLVVKYVLHENYYYQGDIRVGHYTAVACINPISPNYREIWHNVVWHNNLNVLSFKQKAAKMIHL